MDIPNNISCEQLRELLKRAIADIKFAFQNSEELCSRCKHDTPCLAEKCDCYKSGEGAIDQNGTEFPAYKWTCMDFNYGTCDKMINCTPCKDCFAGSKWEWKELN